MYCLYHHRWVVLCRYRWAMLEYSLLLFCEHLSPEIHQRDRRGHWQWSAMQERQKYLLSLRQSQSSITAHHTFLSICLHCRLHLWVHIGRRSWVRSRCDWLCVFWNWLHHRLLSYKRRHIGVWGVHCCLSGGVCAECLEWRSERIRQNYVRAGTALFAVELRSERLSANCRSQLAGLAYICEWADYCMHHFERGAGLCSEGVDYFDR